MITLKKTITKVIPLCVIAIIMISTFIVQNAYAAAPTYEFDFRVQPKFENGQEKTGRLRSTNTTSNRWKVKMTDSDESGSNSSITNFWLENNKGTNVSTHVAVLEDAGWYPKTPKASANQIKVYLTAEDNKDGGTSGYTVKGNWAPKMQ